MSYATLAEFRAYLKASGGAIGEDVLLQMFLDEASAIIDDVIERPSAAAAATTRYFDTPGAMAPGDEGLLFFGRVDVACAITSVVNGDGTTIPATEYTTEPRNDPPFWGIRLKRYSSYTWEEGSAGPEGAIAVTARWAHTSNTDGTVDSLVRGATLQLAAWLYRSKDQVAELSRPVATGDGVTILPMALPQAVLDRIMGRKPLY